ncbi:periplasmic nitrate reductase subunit NapB [Marinobacter daqiaonensis]|uniref:Periplasmic nitrate reductase, electron transfer subunit n=1 Tax=Marinobacter daqiaonensis TaxID=650891 RepID=A0A1I6IL59_9GAMM|nr:nitrate reductase cytochrome c-type subunit [Marinobacter daqiaonensis]SFR67424.1 periplasmic nitrate reductase subunit NapB [Marinobacter daqiaonensis]
MKTVILRVTAALAITGLLCLSAISSAQDQRLSPPAPDGLRMGGTLAETMPAPPIAGDPRTVEREVRNYPEQPPVIPHVIRDYQVDRRFNRCLDCHSREDAVEAGAPMVSITHFMDREGQVRAAVTPRRYFCTQCHVPQTDAKPLVESDFWPAEKVIREAIRGDKQ